MHPLPITQIFNIGKAQPRIFISQSAASQGDFEALLSGAVANQGKVTADALAGLNSAAGFEGQQFAGVEIPRQIIQFLLDNFRLIAAQLKNFSGLTDLNTGSGNATPTEPAALFAQSPGQKAALAPDSLNRPDFSNPGSIGNLSAALLNLLSVAIASSTQGTALANLQRQMTAPSSGMLSTRDGDSQQINKAALTMPQDLAPSKGQVGQPSNAALVIPNSSAAEPYGEIFQLIQQLQNAQNSMRNALENAPGAILSGANPAQRPSFDLDGIGIVETAAKGRQTPVNNAKLALQSQPISGSQPLNVTSFPSGDRVLQQMLRTSVPEEMRTKARLDFQIDDKLSALNANDLRKSAPDGASFSGNSAYVKMNNLLEFLSRQLGLASMEIEEQAVDVARNDRSEGLQNLLRPDADVGEAGYSIKIDAHLRDALQKAIEAHGKFNLEQASRHFADPEGHGQTSSNQAEVGETLEGPAALTSIEAPEPAPAGAREVGADPISLTNSKVRYEDGGIDPKQTSDQGHPSMTSYMHEQPAGNGVAAHSGNPGSNGHSSGGQEMLHPSKDNYETAAANQKEIISQLADKASMAIREGRGIVKIHLQPENLGNVRLEIVTQNHSVRANFIVENSAVREVIRANFDQLKESLSGQGLKADNFSVSVGFDSDRSAWFGPNRFGDGAQGGTIVHGGDSSSAISENSAERMWPVRAPGTAGSLDIFA